MTGPLKRRILIGDADAAHEASLKTVLEDLGYEVECCAEAPTVSDRLLKTPDVPLAAFLDFDLPGLKEICRDLGLQKLESSPWIIAMCDADSCGSSDDARLLQSGVCDTISKPVGKLELQLRLKAAERVQALKEELHRSVEAISFQASHDSLTGLWNREALLPLLFQETDRVRRTSAPMAVMLIDLDHFTHRNLEFGYGICDSVLRQLAVRLRRQLRSYDILGRSGEDEFLVALPGCSLSDAMAMAERLRVKVFHSPFHIRGISLTVRASLGVAQSGGRSPLIVLRDAERALTAAKQAGRDRARCLAPEMSPLGSLDTPIHESAKDLNPSGTNRLSAFPVMTFGKTGRGPGRDGIAGIHTPETSMESNGELSNARQRNPS